MTQLILGIETSCDETAAAVVADGRKILSNVVASQIESHKRFGGVVPEIASRHHVEQITIVLEEAMKKAGVGFSDLTAVAVTQGPGLVGALLVGVEAAKAIAYAHQLPLVPVHHIAGHIYASRLVDEFQFPLLCLVVSGGHTELVYMERHGHFRLLGETRDDAAGEAYDKVARVLGLPYPGGPHIDRLAQEGEPIVDLPRAWLEEGSFDFSFSGLKSAVINAVHQARQKGEEISPENLAASFQDSVTEVLVGKTIRAAEAYGVRQILLGGGVAANQGLRKRLESAVRNMGNMELIIPPISFCTDNAAMIAAAGQVFYENGIRADLTLNAEASLRLEEFNK